MLRIVDSLRYPKGAEIFLMIRLHDHLHGFCVYQKSDIRRFSDFLQRAGIHSGSVGAEIERNVSISEFSSRSEACVKRLRLSSLSIDFTPFRFELFKVVLQFLWSFDRERVRNRPTRRLRFPEVQVVGVADGIMDFMHVKFLSEAITPFLRAQGHVTDRTLFLLFR